MKKLMFLSIIVLSALMISCNKQTAQNEQKDEITAPASQEVAALRVAMDLAKYGYEVESASALIEAANILASVPTQVFDAEQELREATDNEAEKTEKAQLSVESLLADAREMAFENTLLLSMADNVAAKAAAQTEGTRGAVGGPRTGYGRVYARDYSYYSVKFWANEIAEILVSGDGDTDLDLYVYDENGNLIASDTDYTDDCYVRFVPRWTGTFAVKIVNRGPVYNNYVIATN